MKMVVHSSFRSGNGGSRNDTRFRRVLVTDIQY